MVLKVAIVGCGKIADGHVEEIQKLPVARLVGVCDRELLMAEQLAVRYGIGAYYDNFERMIARQRPDVIHITTPPESHVSLSLAALEAGCHIFVEKPLATNSSDAEKIISAVEAKTKKLTIGYTYRFDPPAVAVRRMIANGILGEIVHIESYYGYDLRGAYGKSLLASEKHWVHRLPGKLFQNVIDHILERIVEYVPDESAQIQASGYRRSQTRFEDRRDDLLDELRMTILGKGTSAYGTFSSAARPVGNFARIYGTRNTAHVDYVSRIVTCESSPKLPSAFGRLFPPFEQSWNLFAEGSKNILRFAKSDFHFFAGLNRLISLFYESIIRDIEPPVPYGDVLRVSRMTDEVIQLVFRPNSLERK